MSVTWKYAIEHPVSGPWNFVKSVSWHGAPDVRVSFDFKTIGAHSIPVTPPGLSSGYRMEPHREWVETAEKILKDWESATFERCDLMQYDLECLNRVAGYDAPDYGLWSERTDWIEWAWQFDEAWADLRTQVLELFDDALPHLPPHCSIETQEQVIKERKLDVLPIGNRVMPPTLVDALKVMLAQAETLDSKLN